MDQTLPGLNMPPITQHDVNHELALAGEKKDHKQVQGFGRPHRWLSKFGYARTWQCANKQTLVEKTDRAHKTRSKATLT